MLATDTSSPIAVEQRRSLLGFVVLALVEASALAALAGEAAAAAPVAAGALGRAGAVGLMGWASAATTESPGAGCLRAIGLQQVVLGLAGGVAPLGTVTAVLGPLPTSSPC